MSAADPHRRRRVAFMLHRRGIARTLNRTFASGRYRSAYVETALPLAFLARYASGLHGTGVAGVEKVGPLRRRWNLTA